MANAVALRKSQLPLAQRDCRAAQYVRMSTDYQRYSIQNQAAAIAAYASTHQLAIVRTYTDAGISGLRLQNRPALKRLIEDVTSGETDYGRILVYDVSRWGRFQDVDESAHYEFICKQAGVKISYCAEQFDNDGSLISSILKNIKRVMAAEYSRELSVKVHAGHCRIASLGYRVGAPLTFGLRRELIGEEQTSKGNLVRGQCKALQTDRVRLQLGPKHEIETVRWIFDRFVVAKSSNEAIARDLNKAGIATGHGRPWQGKMIYRILTNENYVGTIVYNRTSRRLGHKLIKNPETSWVRAAAGIEPVIDQELFQRAQKRIAGLYVTMPREQMLLGLRIALHRRGRLTTRVINETEGIPSASSYIKHFGSLRNAFALVGYHGSRNYDWIDSRAAWIKVLSGLAAQISERIGTGPEGPIEIRRSQACVHVRGKKQVSVFVARNVNGRSANEMPHWRIRARQIPRHVLVAIRLDRANKAVQDYVLLPATKQSGPYIRISELTLPQLKGEVFKTASQLLDALARIHGTPLKPRRR